MSADMIGYQGLSKKFFAGVIPKLLLSLKRKICQYLLNDAYKYKSQKSPYFAAQISIPSLAYIFVNLKSAKGKSAEKSDVNPYPVFR